MDAKRTLFGWRAWIRGSAWTGAALTVVLALTFAWLTGTTSGAQFVLDRLLALAGGGVGAVQGPLVGPLKVESLQLTTPALRVRASRIAFDWSPTRLMAGEVRVEGLQADSLEIATAPSDSPVREPATLALPFRLHVAQAGVGRLRISSLGEEAGGVELRDVGVKIAIDSAAWILGNVEALTPLGRARLAGTIGAQAPFALDLKGEISGTRKGAGYRASVLARGDLARIVAELAGSEGTLVGKATANIEPFAAAPLRRLGVHLAGVDLAAFVNAPHTRLAVEAELAPRGNAFLAGAVKVANAESGPLDKDRVPAVSASAQVSLAKDRVEATDLTLAMAGGGRAQGHAVWSANRLDARIAVQEADLLAWHTALRATKLSGDIVASASVDEQTFTVSLADPRFEIAGSARIAKGQLTVEDARVRRDSAFAQASGSLALAGAREFALEGRVEHFDPARFARLPAGEINATFKGNGKLSGGMAGEATLEIAKSQFAGLAAEGRIEFAADATRVSHLDAGIALGATRLDAKGALGHAGDRLEWHLASPDLAPLGRAFGMAIGGRFDLRAAVAGTFAAPSGNASLEASNLTLPGAIRLASFQGRADIGAGEQGPASANVEMRGLARGEEKLALLESAALSLRGTRGAHDIRLEAALPGEAAIRMLLAGGLVPADGSPAWKGRLESFESTGRIGLELAAPAALVVSAGRIELNDAKFSGEAGQVNLALTRWTPAGFEARGQVREAQLRVLARILNLPAQPASNLALSGEWDVRLADELDGTVSLQRERGDIRLGEPRQALGLETLALRAEAIGGIARANVEIRGTKVGRWHGEATATVRKGEDGWEIAPVAPIEAKFAVDVPDIAWTAAWMGPEARAGGHLSGEGLLSGTLRDPTWSGRLEARDIALREPALGAEVGSGNIVIALKDREARIEKLELTAPWQPGEEAARAIAAAKRPAVGTVSAEGAVDLGTRKGSLRVKATGYPLTRLASRFLAVTGEGRVEFDGTNTAASGEFTADAGWFGIPASAPPSLSDDVIVERGPLAEPAARGAGRVRLDLRFDFGEHLHFRGRGLATRLAGSLRIAGDVGAALRTTGSIRAVGGTFDAYGRTLAIERGALNFQGPVDNPGLNVLALRKGLPVEAGVEVLGTVARPKVRLVSSPDVSDPEKLSWLVLGRGQGDVTAGDAATLVTAANSLLGRDSPPASKLLHGVGLDDVSVGRDSSGVLGSLPQSTVAGKTSTATTAEVVTVGTRLTDDIYVSYRQGLADAEGSLRVAWKFTRSLEFILRAGYLPGVDAVYRFNLK